MANQTEIERQRTQNANVPLKLWVTPKITKHYNTLTVSSHLTLQGSCVMFLFV